MRSVPADPPGSVAGSFSRGSSVHGASYPLAQPDGILGLAAKRRSAQPARWPRFTRSRSSGPRVRGPADPGTARPGGRAPGCRPAAGVESHRPGDVRAARWILGAGRVSLRTRRSGGRRPARPAVSTSRVCRSATPVRGSSGSSARGPTASTATRSRACESPRLGPATSCGGSRRILTPLSILRRQTPTGP